MANGNFAGGDGTEENPFLIEDAYDLNAIRNRMENTHYKLINDIDMSVYSEGEGFETMGAFDGGTLDGNMHRIRNIYINRPTDNGGLFNIIRNSTIKNIFFEKSNITLSQGGALSYQVEGRNAGSAIIYRVCFIDSILKSTSTGSSYGLIRNVYAININDSVLIEECSIFGDISGGNSLSGLVGGKGSRSGKVTVKNCYVRGTFNTTAPHTSNYNGMYIGMATDGVIIENGFVASKILRDTGNVYHVTTIDSTVIGDVFFDKTLMGTRSNARSNKSTVGKTTQEMYGSAIYSNWDDEVWAFRDNDYPILRYQLTYMKHFIKSDDKYLTYEPMDTTTVDLTPVMTQNGDPFTVTASSYNPHLPDEPWKIFDDNTSDRPYWLSSDVSGGHWLKIDLVYRAVISRIGFKPQELYPQYGVNQWDLHGSNDDIKFDLLFSGTGLNTASVQYFDVGNSASYRYYRMNFLNNHAPNFPNRTSFKDVYLFGYKAEELGWKTISTTLPSDQVFIDEGMDDLSVLDRKLTTIDIPMNDNGVSGEVLGEGRMFREKIDLKKLIDIRKLNVN